MVGQSVQDLQLQLLPPRGSQTGTTPAHPLLSYLSPVLYMIKTQRFYVIALVPLHESAHTLPDPSVLCLCVCVCHFFIAL